RGLLAVGKMTGNRQIRFIPFPRYESCNPKLVETQDFASLCFFAKKTKKSLEELQRLYKRPNCLPGFYKKLIDCKLSI
ncbi:MAG: hypothetical protein NWS63_04545, partial [Saprospiraceae bacterium]|nr:hypothetical protein [Saprospiraceae bacterium]